MFFQDILEELLPYAAEDEIFILAAIGKVSYIELANPYKDPVPNTVLRVCLHFFFSTLYKYSFLCCFLHYFLVPLK